MSMDITHLKMPKTFEMKVSDIIDLALCAILHKNGDVLDFMIDLFPKIGEEDIQNYFTEYCLLLESQREVIEDNVQILIELLKDSNKWVVN